MIVALVLLLVASVVSPGPNLALVSRTALAVSRRAAAVATVYVCLAMFGTSATIDRAPWLQGVVRVLGGAFLVCITLRTNLATAAGLCRLLGESDFQQTETRGFGSVCSMLETDRYCFTAFSTWTRLGFDRHDCHLPRITKNATEPAAATHIRYAGGRNTP